MLRIEFSKDAVKGLLKFPKNIQKTIKRAIEERLLNNPYDFKLLHGEFKGYRRLRVADYRVIYEIREEERIIFIAAIDVRGKVYN